MAIFAWGEKALEVGPGDEVIVPPYSFIATATCVLEVNAVPVFVDIDPITYNLDPHKIPDAITDRTRAILPVQFAGRIADMARINAIAKEHGLLVAEDAAQAHGASLNGRMAGSLGLAGSFSFQASKNMTAGEGGMVTTNDYELAERIESLASHAYHLYIIRYREEELGTVPRHLFVKALQAEGIPVSTGYPFPLYKNEMFLNGEFWANGCPLANKSCLARSEIWKI